MSGADKKWIRTLSTFTVAMLVCVTGCAEFQQWLRNDFKVGPDYCKPVAPVAADWIDFNDPAVINASLGIDEAAWWRLLADPALESLVNRTYQQNLSLRAAGMRVLEARAQRAIAAGQLLPQFQEGFGSFNHTQFSAAGNQFGIGSLPIRTLDLWSLGFNVGWELDVWGRFRRNLEAADAGVDASIEDYDDILISLIAETAAAYVEMRGFEQRLRYAIANREIQRDSLKYIESNFSNGQVSKLDVSQSKAILAQTEALIPALRKGARLANNRLCLLLGEPPRDLRPELLEAAIPVPPQELVIGIPAELLRRRPDVRRSERLVAQQSARIGVATADLFPAFSIDGSINWQANDFGDMFSSAATGGFINPRFNWQLLNYGRIRNNILVQDAKFQELAIQYQQTALQANAEAEDAITCFLNAVDRVEALRVGVEETARSVELMMFREVEGATDVNRVYVLQRDLVEIQDALADAETEAALGLIKIYKALGGGWQLRLGQLPQEDMIMQQPASQDPVEPMDSNEQVTPASPMIEKGEVGL